VQEKNMYYKTKVNLREQKAKMDM